MPPSCHPPSPLRSAFEGFQTRMKDSSSNSMIGVVVVFADLDNSRRFASRSPLKRMMEMPFKKGRPEMDRRDGRSVSAFDVKFNRYMVSAHTDANGRNGRIFSALHVLSKYRNNLSRPVLKCLACTFCRKSGKSIRHLNFRAVRAGRPIFQSCVFLLASLPPKLLSRREVLVLLLLLLIVVFVDLLFGRSVFPSHFQVPTPFAKRGGPRLTANMEASDGFR